MSSVYLILPVVLPIVGGALTPLLHLSEKKRNLYLETLVLVTSALALLCVRSVFQNQETIQCFNRRIPYDILRNAIAILAMYLGLMFSASFLIVWLEHATLMEAAFEAASAVATVGLTLGITGDLTAASRIILILLMYFGRVGGLTMLYALTNRKKLPVLLPQERINVG